LIFSQTYKKRKFLSRRFPWLVFIAVCFGIGLLDFRFVPFSRSSTQLVFSEEVKTRQPLAKEDVDRLRLISEAYFKLQRHYYREITLSSLEKIFFRLAVISGSVLKNVTTDFDEELDRLVYGTLQWMVLEMRDPTDKFSKFIHHKFLTKVVRENFASKFTGIGIEIEKKEEGFFVTNVYRDSSAAEEGVLVGDKIIRINQEEISEFKLEQVNKLLNIPNKATVLLSILHPGEAQIVDILLTSRIIVVSSVSSKFYEKEKVGYIKIAEFRNETAAEVEGHLDLLIKKKAKGLILDLRGNDGGNMEQAVQISNLFLEAEKLVCFFLKRDVGRQDQKTQSASKDLGEIRKVVILANKKTGSSSEILAGSLRHHKKFLIIGTQTKGMGSLKNTIGLSDGSVLYIITSRTFLPDETTFDAVGLKPDIALENPAEQLQEALKVLALK